MCHFLKYNLFRKSDGGENITGKELFWDFPGHPMVKTSPSNAEVVGLIPGWELRSHMPCVKKKKKKKTNNNKKPKHKKQKQYFNKFKKDFKNGPHHKKKNLKKIFFLTLGQSHH